MGFLKWLNGAPEPQPRFIIGGREAISPNQLGAIYVTSALPSVDMLLEMLFGPGKPGQQLPLARPVFSDPMPARLFLLGMMVASGLIHATKTLGATGLVLQDIMKGTTAELSKLRKPDGLMVNPADVAEVNKLISDFYDLITDEFSNKVDTKPRTPNTEPPKATQLLMSLIVMRYNNGGPSGEAAVAKFQKRGYYDPAYAAMTKLIDEAPKAPLRTLQDMNITFRSA